MPKGQATPKQKQAENANPNPASGEILRILAKAHDYARAAPQDPAYPEVGLIGELQARAGDVDAATKCCAEVKEHYRRVFAFIQVALAQVEVGDRDGAQTTLDRVLMENHEFDGGPGGRNAASPEQAPAALAKLVPHLVAGLPGDDWCDLQNELAHVSAAYAKTDIAKALDILHVARQTLNGGPFGKTGANDAYLYSTFGAIAVERAGAGDISGALDTLREVHGVWRHQAMRDAAAELAKSGDFKAADAIAARVQDPGYKESTLKWIEIIRCGGEPPSRAQRSRVPPYSKGPVPDGMVIAARLLKQAQAATKERAFDKAARDLAAALSAVAPVQSSDYFRDIEGTGFESRAGLIAAIGREQTRAGAFTDALETVNLLRTVPDWGDSVTHIVRKAACRQTLAGQSQLTLKWAEELSTPIEKTHALIGVAEGMIQAKTGALVRMRINYPYKEE
jgi:hypothetical protein